MARIELSNIGGGTTLSLTTTGTSGASTLAGSVLNIPIYQGQLTLTTTGTSGAATLVGNTLNIPNYATGGSPAGSTGEIQYNNAGAFGASSNLAWDNTNVRLNIGAPSAPIARLNVKGGGATSASSSQVWTNSGNTELMRVRDDGNVGIGTNSPNEKLSILGNLSFSASSPDSKVIINSYSAGNNSLYPRCLYRIGNTNSDGNVGLQISPIFDNKPIVLDITNYPTTIGTAVRILTFWVNSSETMITTSSNSGASSGGPLHIGTHFGNTIALPAIYVNNNSAMNVGINTKTPSASAQLDISSTTGGVLFPRMTTTQRNAISSPADGLVLYNTTDNKLQVRAGGAWVDLH